MGIPKPYYSITVLLCVDYAFYYSVFRKLVNGFAVPFFGEHVGGGYPAYSEYDKEKVAGAG